MNARNKPLNTLLATMLEHHHPAALEYFPDGWPSRSLRVAMVEGCPPDGISPETWEWCRFGWNILQTNGGPNMAHILSLSGAEGPHIALAAAVGYMGLDASVLWPHLYAGNPNPEEYRRRNLAPATCEMHAVCRVLLAAAGRPDLWNDDGPTTAAWEALDNPKTMSSEQHLTLRLCAGMALQCGGPPVPQLLGDLPGSVLMALGTYLMAWAASPTTGWPQLYRPDLFQDLNP